MEGRPGRGPAGWLGGDARIEGEEEQAGKRALNRPRAEGAGASDRAGGPGLAAPPPLLPGRGPRVRPPVCDVGGTNLMGFCDSGMRGRMCLVNFGGEPSRRDALWKTIATPGVNWEARTGLLGGGAGAVGRWGAGRGPGSTRGGEMETEGTRAGPW